MISDRKLGPFLATMLMMGGTIGSGIFLLPASLGAFGSISVLAWLAATAGALIIGSALAQLAITRPRAPGLYQAVGEAFGPCASFVTSAVYAIEALVAVVAVAIGVVGYLAIFVPVLAHQPGSTVATIAVIWLLVAACLVGPRFVARFQSWTLLLGLLPVLGVGTLGWFFFRNHIFLASWNVSGQSLSAIVPRASVMAFWAFLGIETASIVAPLVRNPERNVPIATLAGTAITAAIYISASVAIMGILPAAALAKSTGPFADAITPVLGAAAGSAIALLAMTRSVGTLSATILVTAESADSEALFGQARARKRASASASTYLATGFVATLIVVLSANPTLGRQFTIVTDVAVVLSLLVYLAACCALLRFAMAEPTGARFRPLFLGVAGAACSITLVIASEPDLLVWSAGAIALSLAAYFPVRSRRLRLQASPA